MQTSVCIYFFDRARDERGTYMAYANKLETASTLALVNHLPIKEQFEALAAVGIQHAEFSYSFDYYMNELDFPKNAEKIANYASDAGVGLWSLHLPFSSSGLDISQTKDAWRSYAKYTNRVLIDAAGDIGVKVIVMHPSSEPIADDDREGRKKWCRELVMQFAEQCDRLGMRLAVENLPRTCLCNTAAEMIEILSGTGAGVVFDTNHSLKQENPSFIRELTDADLKIISLHISDYDFVDERHRLPGDGINDWAAILRELERAGYNGPLLYEVGRYPKGRDAVSPEMVAENMKWLKSIY